MERMRQMQGRLKTPVRAAGSWEAPVLTDEQQVVVKHDAGPLLVLGGPGTGKTTALVEAAVRWGHERREPPLVLTFSRQAALDLRARIVGRSGRTEHAPQVFTVHGLCFALLRQHASTGEEPLRLLTAPQQEFRVRETLAVDEPTMGVEWPESMAEAVRTQGFAAELRAVIARARQLGMDGRDLQQVGVAAERPEWVSAGAFMEEYLELLDFEHAIDYAELVHRTRILLADDEIAATVRSGFSAVLVDEFQDHDAAQVALLRQLSGPDADRPFIAFGDPDQSVFGFRGADPRRILEFCRQFAAAEGVPAPVHMLQRTHRLGEHMIAALSGVTSRLPLPLPVPGKAIDARGPGFRRLRPAETVTDPGRVEVHLCDSPGAEAEHIADVLRQAHLHEGVEWHEMAVLVRSGRRTLPPLARALTSAGVPVEVAGDEIALSAELAVRPLLRALKVVTDLGDATAEDIARLLTSPLGGLDGLGLRRLGRDLRHAERELREGEQDEGTVPAADELIRQVVIDADAAAAWIDVLGGESPLLAKARALGRLLGRAAEMVASGAQAEEVLWTLWQGTDWPRRLRETALHRGRLDGADRADRDLDAVVALFDVARRSADLPGHRGVAAFLAEVAEQQIPADTQREATVRGQGVRLVTAHRAKGREWDLVVIASVQEGAWPDLRRQGSLLEADRLGVVEGTDGPMFGLAEPASVATRLAQERRLFLVAASRARQRLVVTAVQGADGEAEQPSRFLTDLGVTPTLVGGRPRRPLTLGALVAELRRTVIDPEASPALREAAAVRLARLSDASDDEGVALVPGADPQRWWGMHALTQASEPLVPDGQPVVISPSTLNALLRCPRQWFCSRRASGEVGRSSAAGTGSVMHALLEHAESTDPDILREHLDAVWDRLRFEAPYLSVVEREKAEAALGRFTAWAAERSGRRLGAEVPFSVEVEVAGQPVRLQGKVDRLEQEPDGALRVVDYKTGRTVPDRRDIPGHEQLGVYQLAAAAGAFDDLSGGERRVAGAELVYLQKPDRDDWPTVRIQESLDRAPHLPPDDPRAERDSDAHPTWVHSKLAHAAALIRDENFPATPGPGCRTCAFASNCPAQGTEVVR